VTLQAFRLARTCSPRPQQESLITSVGSKVTGLHEQGRGRNPIYQKGTSPSRTIISGCLQIKRILDLLSQSLHAVFKFLGFFKYGHELIRNVEGSQDRDA